jgi:hypothetical protein
MVSDALILHDPPTDSINSIGSHGDSKDIESLEQESDPEAALSLATAPTFFQTLKITVNSNPSWKILFVANPNPLPEEGLFHCLAVPKMFEWLRITLDTVAFPQPVLEESVCPTIAHELIALSKISPTLIKFFAGPLSTNFYILAISDVAMQKTNLDSINLLDFILSVDPSLSD